MMKMVKIALASGILFLAAQSIFAAQHDTSSDKKSKDAAKVDEEQTPSVNPFGRTWKPPEEARPGTIYFSNDRKVSGLIYSTRGKPLRIFDEKLNKNVDVYIPEILTIQTVVEDEKMEDDWRWLEAASDKKVYTGKKYPRREYGVIITLRKKDKKGKHYRFSGHMSAPIYVLENEKKKPVRFELHKGHKGEIGQTLKGLVYIKKIDFSKKPKDEQEKEGRKQKSSSNDPSQKEEKTGQADNG